jgi:hypothetical protein
MFQNLAHVYLHMGLSSKLFIKTTNPELRSPFVSGLLQDISTTRTHVAVFFGRQLEQYEAQMEFSHPE